MKLPLSSIPPAQILVADTAASYDAAISYLQTLFCKHNACGVCTMCQHIREHQFYAVTWLTTEKQYCLQDLEIIFNKTAYALDMQEHHFFIITSAELLTPACSNSLLKLVEEPPTGYHFLFLTNRPHALLPTIRSRCITHTQSNLHPSTSYCQLSTCFKEPHSVQPAAFLKLLDQSTPSEQETLLIIDELINFWTQRYKHAFLAHNQETLLHAQRMITHLQTALQEPPMPGSSKLFWRNLYVKLIQ